MKEIIKSISKLSIPSGLNLISSIFKNKLLALVAGPIGLGIYSQLMNLSTLLSSVLPIGSLGLVRYISNYHEDNRQKEINFFLIYFFRRNFIISIICTLIILLFYKTVAELILSDSSLGKLIVLFSFFIPFNFFLSMIDIYFKGIRQINNYVFFLSMNSVISTLISIPFIFFLGIEGAILAFLFSVIIGIVSGLLILKKEKLLPNLKEVQPVEKSGIQNIYKLGVGVMLTLAAQQITILVIKSIIAVKLGLSSVGIFQCVYSISAGYFGVFFSLLGTYSIPKVSTFKSNSEIIEELNNTFKLLLLLYTPIITTMFVGRTYIIGILYSKEFLGARELLIYQLPAELVRALSWVLGLWLVPNLKIRQWVTFDLIFYSLFFLMSYISMQYFKFGLVSVSLSYLVAYLVFAIINLTYTIHSINFVFTKCNLRLFLVSVLSLLIAFSISYFWEAYGFFTLVLLLTCWVLTVFKRHDFAKIKILLMQRKP